MKAKLGAATFRNKKAETNATEISTHQDGDTPVAPGYMVKPPSPHAVQRAHVAKVDATGDWVSGRISSKEHAEIHKRADYVIKNQGRVVNAAGTSARARGKRIAGGFSR